MKNKIIFLCLLGLLAFACDKDENIDLVNSSLVYGKLTCTDPKTGMEKKVPKGTAVKVTFNPDAFPFYGYSFKTQEEGIYNFRPTLVGSYDLILSYEDSLIQFNSALVVPKDDLDSTRTIEYAHVVYTDSTRVIITEDETFFNKDFSLAQKGTNLKLILKDDGGNELKGMRVCIYDNETFANRNSPFCGGSLAYLSSDENGEVFFSGLKERAYFIVARGNVGNVSINNQFSGAIKTTGVLSGMITNRREIILK